MMGPEVRADAVLWRQLDGSGMEYCRMSERETDAMLEGVVALWQDVPWGIEYEIRCDTAWRTRSVAIRARAGVDGRSLTLEVDEHGRWTVGQEVRPELQGCVDVDLGFSPSTNTLPIRRLRMNVLQSQTIDAAWVEFPSLAVHCVPQRYTRLDERTYRYENLPTGFAAEITVDARGLVISYPPGWERVDRQPAASPPGIL